MNYALLGLASGLVASGVLAALARELRFAAAVARWALAGIALAWFTRILALRRNARLKLRSTVQLTMGINSERVVCFSGSVSAWLLAFALQSLGLMAGRWFSFVQPSHPPNIYEAVS